MKLQINEPKNDLVAPN